MMGDESYAGAKAGNILNEWVKELTGMPYICQLIKAEQFERILYGILGGKR